MINPAEIALVIGLSTIIALIIIIVLALLFIQPETRYKRPRKASLPPLHGGYRPLQPGQERRYTQPPPRPPEGLGGGSN